MAVEESRYDVVVVGAGNAAFCAAHAARARGLRVVMVEKAPADELGGNSYYTAGAFRVAYDGIDDLRSLLDPESLGLLPKTVVPPYPKDAYYADMQRVTEGRCDPVLTEVLVENSATILDWLHGVGLRFRLLHERQAYISDGVYHFFGGVTLGTVDGGQGLVEQHLAAARGSGTEVRCGSPVTDLLLTDGRVCGVRCGEEILSAGAVVLAAGGFEADPQMRKHHLGDGWENAYVRGTPHNTGEVLRMAIDAGADAHGDWSSCHSVQWDAGAPRNRGSRVHTNQFTRQSYPIGIVVNRQGERFIDEGLDFRNLTYAKYGKEILRQPGGRAVQIFDAKTRSMLRTKEYDTQPITSSWANTLGELGESVGVEPAGLTATVAEFNAAVTSESFDPAVKDGKRADVTPPKSNWAVPIDAPPYYAFPVVCGITFTFGGLRVTNRGQVLDTNGNAIRGMYAAGEIVGGLFSENYPGASGLTAGAVFGRLAGNSAATDLF